MLPSLPVVTCLVCAWAPLWVSDGGLFQLAFRGPHGSWAIVPTLERQRVGISGLSEVLPEKEPEKRKLVVCVCGGGDREETLAHFFS